MNSEDKEPSMKTTKDNKIEEAVARLQGRNKLYRVWQEENNDYDTYDSAVICANSEQEAKEIADKEFGSHGSWTDISYVKVEQIGTAITGLQAGVITASFNAG